MRRFLLVFAVALVAARAAHAQGMKIGYVDVQRAVQEVEEGKAARSRLQAELKEIFATLKVDLQFTIREAEESGDMAWLRGVSKGTVKILKTGVEAKQGYNQLVVFRKEGGAWKIRAYLYGSNRPEPGQTPT